MTENEELSITKEALKWVRENEGVKLRENAGNYGSPRISSEIMDCSMPMTFDSFSYCSMGCLYCTPAETKIKAPIKSKKIKELKIGDKVFSFNTKKGFVEIDVVTSVMERETTELIEIELENEKILKLTYEHPVYVKEKGWIKAVEQKKEDDVIFVKNPKSQKNLSLNLWHIFG